MRTNLKKINGNKPTTLWISNKRKGKENPHAYTMNSKTSEEKEHETLYLHIEPIVDSDPDFLLQFFFTLPFPSPNHQVSTLSKSAPRKL